MPDLPNIDKLAQQMFRLGNISEELKLTEPPDWMDRAAVTLLSLLDGEEATYLSGGMRPKIGTIVFSALSDSSVVRVSVIVFPRLSPDATMITGVVVSRSQVKRVEVSMPTKGDANPTRAEFGVIAGGENFEFPVEGDRPGIGSRNAYKSIRARL